MKTVIPIIMMGFLMLACNKNKEAARKIDGKWQATSVILTTEDGESADYVQEIENYSYTMDFEKCKDGDDGFCPLEVVVTENSGSQSTLYEYKLISDGTYLERKFVFDPTLFTPEEFEDIPSFLTEVKELTKKTLIIETKSDGLTTTITLEKM